MYVDENAHWTEEDAVTHLGQMTLHFLGEHLCILVWLPVEGMQGGQPCCWAPQHAWVPAQAAAYTSLCREAISCYRGKGAARDCASTLSHQQLPFLPRHFFLLLISALHAMPVLAKQTIVEGSWYTGKLSSWGQHLYSGIQVSIHGVFTLVRKKRDNSFFYYFLFCL